MREGYGQVEVQFDMSFNGKSSDDNLFVILNRETGPKKYMPVYKTECKTNSGKGHKWNRVFSSTDALAANNDNSPIMIQIFKYNSSGNHKCVFTKDVTLG